MPTRKQLHDIWVEQYELFDGYGAPKHIYDETMDGHGITQQKFNESVSPINGKTKFTGDEIGMVKYFPDTGEQVFIPNE